MKYQKKSFLVLALAGIVTVLMAGQCGGGDADPDKDKGGEDEFEYTTVKGTVWKNLKKDAANFDNGTVTEVVASGKYTYVATSDKGLWVSEKGGDWKKVDLGKGIAPAAAAGSAVVAEAGVNVKHLTALKGDRVIFAVRDGQKGIIIAEGAVAKRTWAPATTSPAGDTVTSILAAEGADNKERIFVANGANKIWMQLDSADDKVIAAWNTTIEDSAGTALSTTGGNIISTLRLNHDGSALVFSKDQLFGYDTVAKAQWINKGKAAKAHGAVSLVGVAGGVWKDNADMPDDIQFPVAGKAVFRVANVLGYATDMTAGSAANAAVAMPAGVTAPTVINKLQKDGANVKVLSKEGLLMVDGAAGTATVASILPAGDNFMDDKTDAQLEAVAAKTDLTKADLGTTDIKDMAKSAAAKATYVVTDKGLSVGVEKDLKINKKAKTN